MGACIVQPQDAFVYKVKDLETEDSEGLSEVKELRACERQLRTIEFCFHFRS